MAITPNNVGNTAKAGDDEHIYREVFENTSDCFYVFEVMPEGRFKLAALNRAAEKMSRRARADVVGKFLEDMSSSEQLARVVGARYSECVNTGQPVYFDDQYEVLSGKRYLESAVMPVRDKDGRIHRIIAVARDTTERRQMEDALRQSEQRSREVFDNSSDFICVIQVAGEGIFKMEAVNAAAQRATGWSNAEAVGKNIKDLFPDYTFQQSIPAYERCIESGSVVNFEVEANPRTGRRWFETTVVPLRDGNGRIVRLMTVGRDITERKEAEELQRRINEELELRVQERTVALQQGNERLAQEILERKRAETVLAHRSDELARTNTELEAFSYSLSHDLRAPLRTIDGFTQMLSESADSKLDEASQDHLRRVRLSTRRMNMLISDMLKLFRMSRREIRETRIDLSTIAQDIVTELRRAQPKRQVTVSIAPRLTVSADASLMRLALENMLSNAWKFTRDTRNPLIEVGCIHSGHQPTYFVRDNGAGFEMTHADKIFLPFQRLHTEREFEGTGIGLAIVQRVIDRHRGRIWVDSELNSGTTFYFALPPISGDREQQSSPTHSYKVPG